MFFFLGLLFCSNSLACVSYHGIQCDFFSWNTSKVLQDLFYCCDCLINLKYAAVKFNVSQHKRHTNRTQTHTQCNAKYILHAMRGTFFIILLLVRCFSCFSLSLSWHTHDLSVNGVIRLFLELNFTFIFTCKMSINSFYFDHTQFLSLSFSVSVWRMIWLFIAQYAHFMLLNKWRK